MPTYKDFPLIGSHTWQTKKLLSYSTKVASVAPKVALKKSSSKHTHMRYSFEELVARNPTVKTDLNSDARIKKIMALKKLKPQINARGILSKVAWGQGDQVLSFFFRAIGGPVALGCFLRQVYLIVPISVRALASLVPLTIGHRGKY
jgi:hypothetical protein